MFKAARRAFYALATRLRVALALRAADKAIKTRRQREAHNNFQGLHTRLRQENQLHALMLSQRHFRRSIK